MTLVNASFYLRGGSLICLYSSYLKNLAACTEAFDFIDSLGHIDYVCRYAVYPDKELYYSEFAEAIDCILSVLAKKDKALEINTRRFDQPEALQALTTIYKRWAELGGQLVTIGSDAHNVQTIGRAYRQAMQLADYCGLRPVWFQNRQPKYIV